MLVGACACACGCGSRTSFADSTDAGANTGQLDAGSQTLAGPVLYVASDSGDLDAFQVGAWTAIGHWSGLPFTDGVRGVDVDPAGGILYISHGSDGGGTTGSLLAWNLATQKIIYDKVYAHSIDQFAFGGGRIYMPAGVNADSTTWYVVDAADGSELSTEQGGSHPHDTIFLNGHRYYGGHAASSLVILGTGAGIVGPSPSSTAGVTPFTVNAAETRVWITWNGYRGFSVGDVATGAIVASVDFGPMTSVASHGITLAPDGSEVYVIDTMNNAVRVYDGTDSPALLATIALTHPVFPGNESPCAYDCQHEGWLLHSYDGRYVYVGDSGDILDTRTRQVAGYLPVLANTRHGYLEVQWSNGQSVATTTHFGRGR